MRLTIYGHTGPAYRNPGNTLLADELNAFRAAGFRVEGAETDKESRKATFFTAEILSDKFSDKIGL